MAGPRRGDETGMRLAGVSGLLFAALVVASGLAAHAPAADAPAEEIARAFADDRAGHRASAFLMALAALAALGFTAGLAALLAPPRGASTALAGLVLAAGGAAVALVLAGQAAHATLALADDLSPSAVVGLFAAGNALFTAAWFPLALLVAAVSGGALALRAVPSWLGSAGLLFALVLLAVGASGFLGGGLPPVLGVLGLVAWVTAVSVGLLVRRESGRR